MTFTDAAAEDLRLVGRPLHYKEITDIAIEKNLLSHVGKSPEVTMGARLAAMLKKDSPENPLVRVKPGVVCDLNQKVYERIEAWRNEPIQGEHPYVYLDGIWLKRSWGGEVKNIAVLVAIGVVCVWIGAYNLFKRLGGPEET